jgi:hypothetical protein
MEYDRVSARSETTDYGRGWPLNLNDSKSRSADTSLRDCEVKMTASEISFGLRDFWQCLLRLHVLAGSICSPHRLFRRHSCLIRLAAQ